MSEFMERIRSITERQDRFIEATVNVYVRHLWEIVTKVQAQIGAYLQKELTLTAGGDVALTPGNQDVLRSMDRKFAEFMKKAGFEDVTKAFVSRFPGQLPYFQETLQALSDAMQTPLPALEWTQADLRVFSSLQLSYVTSLKSVVTSTGKVAMQRALMTVGGLPYKDLVETIASEFGKSVTQAEAIGATAMPVFYRTVADRGFKLIEADLPEMEIRYTYEGPCDNLTRPWCREKAKQARDGRTWTRAEIDVMDNGSSLSNVFLNGGGWRCRHQWIVAPPEVIG